MIEALYEATGGDAIVTSDVGQHQMWCAQYFHFDGPRKWINSGGARHDGLRPAERDGREGGQARRPDVVCVAGDGSVIMNIQELATCVTENIPIKVFIMNNGYLGMVRQWQELFWDRRYSAVEMGSSPDWVKLAEAFGAKGMLIEDKSELLGRHEVGAGRGRPGGLRRARDPRGELLPDDPRRPGRAGHGGLSAWASPGTKEVAESRGSRGVQRACAPGAGTCCRCWSRTSRACWRGSPGLFARRGLQHRLAGGRSHRRQRRSRASRSPSTAPTHPIDQVTKQLHKLVNVIKIRDLEPAEAVARELALFKIVGRRRQPRPDHGVRRHLPRPDRGRVQALGDRRGHRAPTTRSRRSSRCAARSA